MNFIKKKIKTLTNKNTPDYTLFFLSSALIIISILFSYSLSIYTVVYWDYNQYHFFIRELFTGVLAILIMWTFAQIKPDKIVPIIGWILFGVFFLLMVSIYFLPSSWVTESGGAKRWIRLPFVSISPIEFFKIGFIYFLANSFNRKLVGVTKTSFIEEVKIIIPYMIVFVIVAAIMAILLKDLGQTVLLALILFIMMMFANRSGKLFASIIGIAIVGLVALILPFKHRVDRILSWWSMIQDGILSLMPSDMAARFRVEDFSEPYQVSNSLNAINNGGFFGTGLGEGSLKLGFLSDVHTDFVLAGITEEIGLIGLIFVVGILFAVIYRIFLISQNIKKTEYHLFTLGIGLMISISFLINSYGISAMIPIKGIAVPFLSYGGSSMLSIAIAVGLVLSISRDLPKRKKHGKK